MLLKLLKLTSFPNPEISLYENSLDDSNPLLPCKQVHAQVVKFGFCFDCHVGNGLVVLVLFLVIWLTHVTCLMKFLRKVCVFRPRWFVDMLIIFVPPLRQGRENHFRVHSEVENWRRGQKHVSRRWRKKVWSLLWLVAQNRFLFNLFLFCSIYFFVCSFLFSPFNFYVLKF